MLRSIRNTIFGIIFILELQTRARFAAEVVVGVGEVLEPRQRAYARRNLAGEFVAGDVQLLEAPHVPHRLRQAPDEFVLTDVKNRQLRQFSDRLRQAAFQAGVHEDYLIERVGHFHDPRGQAPPEVVVREDQDGDRRVPKIFRQPELEPVVVDEECVEFFIEEAVGDGAGEFVVPDVEEFEGREAEDDGREPTGEDVVANVKLVE